jgi:hypothetical protein
MSFDLNQPEIGIRILDEDAILIEKKPHLTEQRAWSGTVEVKGENLDKRFGISRIALGTKSCLAQLGVFVSIQHKGKTKTPDVEVNKSSIVARIKGSHYSRYPVSVEEGSPIGRFFNKVGAHLNLAQVKDLMRTQRDLGKQLYEEEEGAVDEDGGVILTARNTLYPLNPSTQEKPPYKVTSRRHLDALLHSTPVDGSREIEQGEFIVTDTPKLLIPKNYAGLLWVDQVGDMAMPAHLNSPLVDPGYEGNLRLELWQGRPPPGGGRQIFVRLYIFGALQVYSQEGQREMF